MGQEQSSSCTQVLPFAKSQFLFLTLDKYANINMVLYPKLYFMFNF